VNLILDDAIRGKVDQVNGMLDLSYNSYALCASSVLVCVFTCVCLRSSEDTKKYGALDAWCEQILKCEDAICGKVCVCWRVCMCDANCVRFQVVAQGSHASRGMRSCMFFSLCVHAHVSYVFLSVCMFMRVYACVCV